MVASIKNNNERDKMSEDKKIIVKGVPASQGIAKGKVKIILSPADVINFGDGEILVAPFTNPHFTPAILKAIAIVTEVGGMLSHPAIVARELGIPCVTGVIDATKILKNGQEMIVDGNHGVVYEQ
jgi:pyruvate,water dikinase